MRTTAYAENSFCGTFKAGWEFSVGSDRSHMVRTVRCRCSARYGTDTEAPGIKAAVLHVIMFKSLCKSVKSHLLPYAPPPAGIMTAACGELVRRTGPLDPLQRRPNLGGSSSHLHLAPSRDGGYLGVS